MPRKVKEWIGKIPDSKIPPRIKLKIWTRENGICHLSGRKIMPGELYDFDHKVALINGGLHTESNLFPALRDKHREKTAADLAEKSRVAARAKSNIGAKSAPARPIKSAGFRPSPKQPAAHVGLLPLKRRELFR
jgi:5-methylcytosine-specific restriction endonuclease McrA